MSKTVSPVVDKSSDGIETKLSVHANISNELAEFKYRGKSVFGEALLQKEMQLKLADNRLLEKRKHFQRKISESTARRADLTAKQIDLKEQMKKFEGFVHDNEAKRARAMGKFQTEQNLCKIRTKEEAELRTDLNRVKLSYENMKKQVEDYKKFETYLLEVIDILPPDYIKIADNVIGGLIMRYNTLYETNQSLLKEMNEKSEHIREANCELVLLREEHGSRILTLNSELASLYTTRERTNEICQQQEQIFTNAHRELRTKLGMFGTIIRSIDNLVGKCAWPYTASTGDLILSTKLQRIKEYILTTRNIIAEIELVDAKTITKSYKIDSVS